MKEVKVTGHGAIRLWPAKHWIIWTYQNTWKTWKPLSRWLGNWFSIAGICWRLHGWRFREFSTEALLVALTFSIFLLTLRPRRIRCLGHWPRDSDERVSGEPILTVRELVWQLSVSSLVKNDCWSPVLLYLKSISSLIKTSIPKFELRFYPIKRSYPSERHLQVCKSQQPPRCRISARATSS